MNERYYCIKEIILYNRTLRENTINCVTLSQERKTEPDCGDDINPISRLMQIQQMKKEKEPVYTLVEEKGMPRRREFIMEVSRKKLLPFTLDLEKKEF